MFGAGAFWDLVMSAWSAARCLRDLFDLGVRLAADFAAFGVAATLLGVAPLGVAGTFLGVVP